MKQLLLLFVCLCVGLTTIQAQIVYVDAGATGTNDGSTWANAFTDLTVALDSASSGDALWLAAGRYVTPDSSSFMIDRELSLYGGFAGGETSLEDADPEANETILSGDVDGNDGVGTYDSLLAVDNNRVLMILDTAETSQYTVTLDGLTIRDGAIADDIPADASLLSFAGGGIYSEARLAVSRVRFTANRANFGAAACVIFNTTAGSTFESVTSEGNYTDANNDFYIRLTSNVSFTNSSFIGSNADTLLSGAVFAQSVAGFSVGNCSFSDIIAPSYRGTAIQTADVLGVSITNSTFDNLVADLGGALYIRNANLFLIDRPTNAGDVVIDSCEFTDIYAERWGGTIFFGNTNHRITNSSFTNGIGAVTGGIGGAVYAQAGDSLIYAYEQSGNTYTNNQAGGSGGAIFYFSDNAQVRFDSLTFDGNNSGSNGGAIFFQGAGVDTISSTVIRNSNFLNNSISGGFGAAALLLSENSTVTGCTFENNSGTNGSLYVGSGGKTFRVVNTEFRDNGSASNPSFTRGAGIWGGLDGGAFPDTLMVDSCSFSNNVVTNDDFISGGAAIYLSGDVEQSPLVRVMNSSFNNNAAINSASGAIEVVNGIDLRVEDSDFVANSSNQEGGAITVTRTISRDTVDNVPLTFYRTNDFPTIRVERSLFVNNTAATQGGAINLFSAPITMRNSMLIGNTITSGGGSGGAVIINGSNSPGAELDNYFINNTFYNNVDGGRAPVDSLPTSAGNAIAVYQPGNTNIDTNSVTLTIQNNAFFQVGADQESIGLEFNVGDAEDETGFGAITVNSLGGNYFNSNADGNLTITDVSGENVTALNVDVTTIFLDPTEEDRESEYPNLDLIRGPDDNNPLIDAGTTGPLVPEVDFFNEPRDSMPDIGAIEYNGIRVDVAEPIQNSGLALKFFPNPTTDVLNITNEDASVTRFTVLVSDMQGRFLAGRQFGTGNSRLDLTTLPKGVYNLSLLINGKTYSQQIVKQ